MSGGPLEPVLWSEFESPDELPDPVVVGEERPEDGVRIVQSEPGVVGYPSWPEDVPTEGGTSSTSSSGPPSVEPNLHPSVLEEETPDA